MLKVYVPFSLAMLSGKSAESSAVNSWRGGVVEIVRRFRNPNDSGRELLTLVSSVRFEKLACS